MNRRPSSALVALWYLLAPVYTSTVGRTLRQPSWTICGNLTQVILFNLGCWWYISDTKTWKLLQSPSKKLPGGIANHTSVVFASHLYLIAGTKKGQPTSDVWQLNLGIDRSLVSADSFRVLGMEAPWGFILSQIRALFRSREFDDVCVWGRREIVS